MYENHLDDEYQRSAVTFYSHNNGPIDNRFNNIHPNMPNVHALTDVSHSQLQPTAQEFTPSASRNVNRTVGDGGGGEKHPANLGAVKKDGNSRNRYWNNSRNNKYKKKNGVDGNSWGTERYRQSYGSNRVGDDYYRNNCGAGANVEDYYDPNNYKDRNYDNVYVNGFAGKDPVNFGGRSNTYFNSNVVRNSQDTSEYNNWRSSKINYDSKKYNRNGRYTSSSWKKYNSDRENWKSERTPDGNKFLKKQNISEDRDKDNKITNNDSPSEKVPPVTRREQLEELIWSKTLECLVCCEKLRHYDKIWNCKLCYHILHLKCIKQWADSSKYEGGWRCPACQNNYSNTSIAYFCFCGKRKEPENEPALLPHSCGEICARKGRSCDHKCSLLCHPGPCPECTIMVVKKCGCGRTEMTLVCSSSSLITCNNVCGKDLACGSHTCPETCHTGECPPCDKYICQECFCGKVGRKVPCTMENKGVTKYTCGEICEKLLSCGNHKCSKICHDGPCEDCELTPEKVKFCPCGQSVIADQRLSCLDPIPCCGKVCNKRLICGQPSHPHLCQSTCHLGPCPPCSLTTMVRCRCGHMDKEIACAKLTTKADDARCEKKCTKKRLCGKHKCNQRCCIEIEHVCPLPCNRLLSCGLHRCPLTCHNGKCPPCLETSFEELYCECGASVIYPPVPCGTRPPKCNAPCSRPRACGHEVNHTCHTGACPPCTVLCKRSCYGKHEVRPAIPCHQEKFSCGLPCGRMLSCGRHKCIKPCHDGDCPPVCTQPCTETREACGHICGAPCHEPPCPETPCKSMVKVTCQCGLHSSQRACLELAGEYQNIAVAGLVSKMAELQKEQTVDISDIVTNGTKRPVGPLKVLECNDECRLVERNRRLAIGLQIRNPDLSAKLTPRYSDYMRQWAKKDPRFCQRVHDKLTELVKLAKESKQKSRSYSFESMNRDKRQFVHEYCEHFGCESAAYDQEPNRNVVATAMRDKSWLPSVSLLDLMRRESGQKKVPGPVLMKGGWGKNEAVSMRVSGRNMTKPVTPPGDYMDYLNGN